MDTIVVGIDVSKDNSPPAGGIRRAPLDIAVRPGQDVFSVSRDAAGLDAGIARLAPLVGSSQPWRFVSVETRSAREAVIANFSACNASALASYEGERTALYARLKLSGLREAPVHLAVFCDHATDAGFGLGRKPCPRPWIIQWSRRSTHFGFVRVRRILALDGYRSSTQRTFAARLKFRRNGSSSPSFASGFRKKNTSIQSSNVTIGRLISWKMRDFTADDGKPACEKGGTSAIGLYEAWRIRAFNPWAPPCDFRRPFSMRLKPGFRSRRSCAGA